jgi:drug/metabolite transporter (DMT)-like permease
LAECDSIPLLFPGTGASTSLATIVARSSPQVCASADLVMLDRVIDRSPAHGQTTGADDPVRGIGLAVAATMGFAAGDATAKFLTASLPVIEIIWLRYVIFAAIAVWLTRGAGGGLRRPRSVTLQLARGLCVVGSAILFVFATKQLPLAEASTISFVSPVLLTILAIPLLGEVVGIRRWSAVAVGLIGVVVVVRPGTGGFHPAALFALASSLCWAFALVITRKIASTERSATTLVWSAATGLVLLTALLPWNFVWLEPWQWPLALLLGVMSSTGQSLIVLAHRYAPASLLAPFSYAQLLWATVAGYLVFHALPDGWTWSGAAIIATSGLYTVHRERVRARERAAGVG